MPTITWPYNVLPRWSPPKLHQNRGQWQGSDAYKVFKKPYDDLTNKGPHVRNN